MMCVKAMPSHTYFYKILSEYGTDHDLEIRNIVDTEGKRKSAVILSKQPTANEVEPESTRESHQTCTAAIKVKA